jgi:hypothetical protein
LSRKIWSYKLGVFRNILSRKTRLGEPYDLEGNIIFWHYELEDDEENNNKGEQK